MGRYVQRMTKSVKYSARYYIVQGHFSQGKLDCFHKRQIDLNVFCGRRIHGDGFCETDDAADFFSSAFFNWGFRYWKSLMEPLLDMWSPSLYRISPCS